MRSIRGKYFRSTFRDVQHLEVFNLKGFAVVSLKFYNFFFLFDKLSGHLKHNIHSRVYIIYTDLVVINFNYYLLLVLNEKKTNYNKYKIIKFKKCVKIGFLF